MKIVVPELHQSGFHDIANLDSSWPGNSLKDVSRSAGVEDAKHAFAMLRASMLQNTYGAWASKDFVRQ